MAKRSYSKNLSPRFYTKKQLAQYLGFSEQHIMKIPELVAIGFKIDPTSEKSEWRWDKEKVDNYMESLQV